MDISLATCILKCHGYFWDAREGEQCILKQRFKSATVHYPFCFFFLSCLSRNHHHVPRPKASASMSLHSFRSFMVSVSSYFIYLFVFGASPMPFCHVVTIFSVLPFLITWQMNLNCLLCSVFIKVRSSLTLIYYFICYLFT